MNRRYTTASGTPRRDMQQTIVEYAHVLRWREEGGDSILDVGCFCGESLMEFILPILPENFGSLVGVDKSEELIKLARQKFYHPKVTFVQFDIGVDIKQQPFVNLDLFDHITSFYCLNWVRDQECAVRNFYTLLKPGGDMLVAFIARHRAFDVYKLLSRTERWAEYLTNIDDFISPYHYSASPVDQFDSLLASAGFSKHKVELYEIAYGYGVTDELRGALKEVNSTFFDHIPEDEQEAFAADYLTLLTDMGLDVQETKYSYLIAHATK